METQHEVANDLQKDNWAHLLKCQHAINLSYKVLHARQ